MGRALIAGLGNPDPEHTGNRHNVGFMVLEELARRGGESLKQRKFLGRFTTANVGGSPAVLLLPETYMNLSGRSIARAVGFYGVALEELVVVHDDMDLPYGRLRLKQGGGHGGHNGLRSMHKELGSNEYLRVRMGIGRPPHGDATGHVLSDFTGDEQAELALVIDLGANAVEALLRDGFKHAANAFNGDPS
jgi:PTH1 family peptidyl-tRNA hydrolase